MASVGKSCAGGGGGGHGGVKLLLADDVLCHQRPIAFEVGLSLDVVGLGLGDAGVRGLQLLLGLRSAGLCAAHVGPGRTQIAAGVDRGDRHVDLSRGGIGLGAGQSGLGFFHRNLVVAGVQLGDHVARLHHLVFFDVDLEHLSTDARADLDQMAVDLRVVGILAVGRVPPEPGRRQRQNDHNGDHDAPAAGRWRRALKLCGQFG